VRDTISLGLEVLLARDEPQTASDPADATKAAAQLLGQWHLRDLFRHGHAATAELARAARALAADPVLASWLDKVEPEGNEYTDERRDRAFLRALIQPKPLYAGLDLVAPDRARAFGSRKDLREAEARLEAVRSRYL